MNFLFPNKKDGSLFKQIDNLKASCNLKKFKNTLKQIEAFEEKLINDGEYIKPKINRSNFWELGMKKIRK